MDLPKNIICIVGPTAIGKTAFAIKLAQKLDTEIISADSRQFYRELNIGVARPSKEELNLIPHHFIANYSIHQPINAAIFEQAALQKIESIFEKKNNVIVVGGSGLYINALLYGLDDMPIISADIKNYLQNKYKENGIQWLQNEIIKLDPNNWQSINFKNPHRLLRALEIVMQTNKSIVEFQTQKNKPRTFTYSIIGLQKDRNQLYNLINNRVENMFEMGLENEVKFLLEYQHLPILQTVGYSELFDYFNKKVSLQFAKEKIKQHTRNYAKRQITWFNKNKEIKWINVDNQP